MKKSVKEIIDKSRAIGWVMEPYAKEILSAYSISVPRFKWAKSSDEALSASRDIGYPVVAKVVSPEVVHKTEVGGVAVGISGDEQLIAVYNRMSALPGFDGVLIDEMVKGKELIIGSKNDVQFGPVVLIVIGGTAVKIYRDVVVRMAPTTEKKALGALNEFRGRELLTGHRGEKPVNLKPLVKLIERFSEMVIDLREWVESIDMNPVFSNEKNSFAADARFILADN
ncbi:MAG TPA: acetyl-CoA synthetase [Spirochaetes bacterium]|nr:acetyl-CoA synthetase [Spirochaetota bacterium]